MPLDKLVAEAKRVAAEVVAPRSAEWDRQAEWPEEAVRALQRAGLAGLVVPKEHGGAGGGLSVLLEVCEILGREDASVGLCFGMHAVGSACLAAEPTDEQAARWLGPICAGRHWTTLALSEPGTGAHFYLPNVAMREDGDAFVLDGAKSFVTNGNHADSYVVSTALSGGEVGEFAMLLVDAAAVDGAWGEPWAGWGMRANSSRTVTLDGVRVSRDNLLGGVGDQIWYVFHVVTPYFLVAMAGTYLGVASRALSVARDHLVARIHGHTGRTLAELDVLQHRFGTLWAKHARTHQLCRWAAAEADAGGPDALAAICSAKAEVATATVELINECMTLVGGRGYAERAVLPRLLRDARAAHVMSPTTDLLYGWVGRANLGLPLLGT